MTMGSIRAGGRRTAHLGVVVVAFCLALAGCGGGDASGPQATSPSVVAPSPTTASPAASPSTGGTAKIVATKQLAGRMRDLTIRSPAMGSDVKVRLLLPARFDREPTRRWPVLYLLHGCCDSYASWSRSTDIEKLTRDTGVLVVMPDGGKVGFYSNWVRGPKWEDFHLTELPALLSQQYRAGPRRAIAGVSMGGLGALGYAARHPGMFAVAASFSGIVHTRLSGGESQAYLGLVQSQGEEPLGLWGDPTTDEQVWKAHNPYDLAAQLKPTKLFISAGTGEPGPLDRKGTTSDQTEAALRPENDAFAAQVRALRLNAQIDLYTPGTHNWVYWQREFHKAWPLVKNGLGVS